MFESKQEWGADADGNRGIEIWVSDLDSDDTEAVCDELEQTIPIGFKELVEVTIQGQAADYTHEVRACDWMSLEEYNIMMGEFGDEW